MRRSSKYVVLIGRTLQLCAREAKGHVQTYSKLLLKINNKTLFKEFRFR
jgi:hypothetical protein